MAGYAPYLSIEQKLWLLETVDVGQRLAKLIEWGREHLAELDVAERIRSDVHEGMEKTQREFLLRQQLAAIRKELGERRAGRRRRLPHPRGGRRASRERARGGAARGRPARAHERPEPRGGLDPHVAGHGARAPVERPHR